MGTLSLLGSTTCLLLLAVGVISLVKFVVFPTPDPISVVTQKDGTQVGISDGRYIFDTSYGADKATRSSTAMQLRNNHPDEASHLFDNAIKQDPSDAEALIYREDLRALQAPKHITIVVPTVFSSQDVPISQASLQGAYVAQKEFNDGVKLHDGSKVYILIANSASGTDSTQKVAQQIVALAQSDKTFVGVMGWPYSTDTLRALTILKDHNIPVVAGIASSDQLTGISPYFFRISPTDAAYGIAGANYATNMLHKKRVVIFTDPNDPYSGDMAAAFDKQFRLDGGTVVATEHYTARQPQTLSQGLNDLANPNLDYSYDLIYFSGIASDMSAFLSNLLPGNIPVMGGSGSYLLGDYTHSAQSQLGRLHFTSPAYPDEWKSLAPQSQEPVFFTKYSQDFDPSGKNPGAYGLGRPTYEAILAYDGTLALLQAVNNVLDDSLPLSPENVRAGLAHIDLLHPLSGASGQIAFDGHGDSINNAILSVSVVQQGSSKFFKLVGHLPTPSQFPMRR